MSTRLSGDNLPNGGDTDVKEKASVDDLGEGRALDRHRDEDEVNDRGLQGGDKAVPDRKLADLRGHLDGYIPGVYDDDEDDDDGTYGGPGSHPSRFPGAK